MLHPLLENLIYESKSKSFISNLTPNKYTSNFVRYCRLLLPLFPCIIEILQALSNIPDPNELNSKYRTQRPQKGAHPHRSDVEDNKVGSWKERKCRICPNSPTLCILSVYTNGSDMLNKSYNMYFTCYQQL